MFSAADLFCGCVVGMILKPELLVVGLYWFPALCLVVVWVRDFGFSFTLW